MKLRAAVSLVWLAIGILAYAGAGKEALPPDAERALREFTAVSLYSLEPGGIGPVPGVESSGSLHHHKSLGFVALDQAQGAVAISALKSAIAQRTHQPAMCFFPRHALRVTTGKKVYDFLICYECDRLDVYFGETAIASLGISGSSDVLDGLLTATHIPLAKKPQ